MFHVQERVLDIGGTRIDTIAFGKGKKPLVMIQGLNTRGIKGAGKYLALMYRIFAKDFRVYLFDRRQDVREGITVRELARDTAAAMDALDLRNADVFGVSQGGMIAQYLALDRPDLVGKLVLAATLSRNNDTIAEAIENWTEMAARGDMKNLITDMALKMYSDRYLKRYRPFLPLLTFFQKPRDVQRFIILAKACLTCDTYEKLDEIKCPVFVIGGNKDRIVGSEASREIAEKLGCDIYMYDDYGHAVYEEAKDFNKRVYDFLMKGR